MNRQIGAWLDEGQWMNNTGKWPRLQTAAFKHNKRVNVIYVDGHAAPSLPSALTYGQFAGAFSARSPNVRWLYGKVLWNTPLCPPQFDAVEWSSKPE